MNIWCCEAAKDQQHKAQCFKGSIFVQAMFQIQFLSSCSATGASQGSVLKFSIENELNIHEKLSPKKSEDLAYPSKSQKWASCKPTFMFMCWIWHIQRPTWNASLKTQLLTQLPTKQWHTHLLHPVTNNTHKHDSLLLCHCCNLGNTLRACSSWASMSLNTQN